jgi:hypothetical protein
VDLYFAYGSNMSSRRLRARLPAARALGPARLPGMRRVVNKLGKDGSGKVNVIDDPASHVWGVVFVIARADWSELDRHEWGYARRAAEVLAAGATERLAVQIYVAESPLLSEGLPPFDWYRDFLVEGAREHALPDEVIASFESLEVIASR